MIPIIIAGAAAKGFVDSMKRVGEADYYQDISETSMKGSYGNYLREVERTAEAVDELNERKISVLGNEITKFVNSFSKIKNIDFQETNQLMGSSAISFSESQFKSLQENATDLFDYLHKGSKVNVLGQMVIGSIFLKTRSKTILNNAKSNRIKSEIEHEKLNIEIEAMKFLRTQTKQMNKMLRKTAKIARNPIELLEKLTELKTNWNEYSVFEKEQVASVVKWMQLVKMIIDQPIVTESGEYDRSAEKILNDDNLKAIMGE